LPTPPSATADQVALGNRIFHRVTQPKQYQGVMPPLGGAPLSPPDVAAVAAYVWAVGHAGKP
jgi:hypothetical protein